MDDRNKSKEGQGFNDARGEFPDKKDIPKNNGQNVNNDPATLHKRKRFIDENPVTKPGKN